VKKRSEETQKNYEKRQERKKAEGRLGRFWSWVRFLESKPEIKIEDFNEYLGNGTGRIGNRIYSLINGKYKLFKKCKNATKAKKFIRSLSDELN